MYTIETMADDYGSMYRAQYFGDVISVRPPGAIEEEDRLDRHSSCLTHRPLIEILGRVDHGVHVHYKMWIIV